MHVNKPPSSMPPTKFARYFRRIHLPPVYFSYPVHFFLFLCNHNLIPPLRRQISKRSSSQYPTLTPLQRQSAYSTAPVKCTPIALGKRQKLYLTHKWNPSKYLLSGAEWTWKSWRGTPHYWKFLDWSLTIRCSLVSYPRYSLLGGSFLISETSL